VNDITHRAEANNKDSEDVFHPFFNF